MPLFGNSEALAVFSLAIVSMLLYNYLKFQTFYYPSPDGDLYLSIARNFIQNGHFIQTARPHEVNMIVPPGVPLIFTVVLGLTYSYVNIIIVQYVLFGLSAALLAKAAGFFSRTTFYIVPVLFVSACVYIGTPNPSSLLTETYTVFLLSLSLFIFLRPDRSAVWKASLLLPIQFFALLVRPVVGGLLAAVYAGMAVLVFRKKIPFKRLAAYSAAFAAVLALNTWVNYRETGYAVMLEDYGAPAAYLANNSNTKTTHYDSSLAFEFGDSYFKSIRIRTWTCIRKVLC